MLSRFFASSLLMLSALSPLAAQEGWLEWEYWAELPASVSVNTLVDGKVLATTEPVRRQRAPRFESARDAGEHFGVRLRGWLHAPADGMYRFRLEAQGDALLRMSGDAGSTVTVVLARVRDGVALSEPLRLEAGRRYLMEAFHRSGEGPDSLRVGWTPPDRPSTEVIPGTFFSTVSGLEALATFNLRRAYHRPFTAHYDWTEHLARDRHSPKKNEHLTRETVYAAAAMLDLGDAAEVKEAALALAKVLPLQEQRENTWRLGNWPRVVQRPDDFSRQNIGGFIGEELIIILLKHRDRLPPELVTQIESAIRRAALRSVRYNPPVTATNIVTKAVAVALLADQLLDVPDAREWATERLRELHAHTLAAGVPSEYNSPTYNSVAMKALALLRQHLRDEGLRPLVEDLYRATWRELALNYHPNLQLWTGPASRRYELLHSPAALLQEATANRLFLGVNSHEPVSQTMPPEFAAYFEPLREPVQRTVPVQLASPVTDLIDQRSLVPLTATIYHAPEFTLGSFNRGDLWNQRRPLIAYWGRRDVAGYFQVSTPSGRAGLLAAQMHTLQEGGQALAAVTFATDAGWGRDPYDLPKDVRAEAPKVSTLRLRMEIGGPGGGGPLAAPAKLHDPIVREIPGGRLEVRLLYSRFGDKDARWEVTPDGHLDLVLHSGEATDLGSVPAAAAVFAISLAPHGASLPAATARADRGRLHLVLGEQRLSLPLAPATYAGIQAAVAESLGLAPLAPSTSPENSQP